MKADFKRLKNPIVKQRKKQAVRRKMILYTVSVFLILFAIIYIIFATPLFKIKEIKLNDLKEVNNEEVMQIIEEQRDSRFLYIFSQDNLLLFNKQKLKNDLSEYNFKDIKIKKNLFSELDVTIEERKLSYILEDDSYNYYHLDENMNLIKSFNICKEVEIEELTGDEELGDYEFQTAQFEDTEGDNMQLENQNNQIKANNCHTDNTEILNQSFTPIIKNNSNNSLINTNTNAARINQEQINIISFLYSNLIGLESDIRLSHFIIDETMFEVKAKLKSDTIVIFSTKDNIEDQYRRFSLFVNEYKEEVKNMKTIDFRYQDMIYYKKD